MTISIEEATQIITVDQADLTFVSGALYDMDTNDYRLAVGALLDDERYMWMDPAFIHNTQVTVAGTTFARTIEQINGYSLTLENLTYSARMINSNNNLFDVENGILNPSGNVTVVSTNAAGLIVNQGQSIGQGDIDNISAGVWAETIDGHPAGSTGAWLKDKVLTVSKFLGLS